MTTYKILTNELGFQCVERTTDDGIITFIPMVEANSDYQAYLATLAANSAPTDPSVVG